MTRTYLASLLFVTASLGACGGSSSSTADAPGASIDANLTPDSPPGTPDAHDSFACAGAALPTTAPASLLIMGDTETISLSGTDPVTGASVASYGKAGGASLASATSNNVGGFQLTVDTGGAPLDGYILATKATYLDTYLYPPSPLAADTDKAKMLMITPGTFTTLQSIATVTQTAGKGFVGVIVSDCDYKPVAGATITISSGDVRYTTSGLPSKDALVTDTDGVALIFNVNPGAVTVTATAGGVTYRAHTFDVRADVVTTTAVQP